jgi:DNA recombination protein RmuC
MEQYVWWAIGAALIGGVAGFLLGHLRASAAVVAERTRSDENSHRAQLADEERKSLAQQLQGVSAALATEKQKVTGLEESRVALKAEIEVLAQSILEDKSRRFTEQNRSNLEQLLGPLWQKLEEFKKQVNDVYGKESESRAALASEVKRLGELNLTVSREAGNLTQALKGQAKTRGNWGELILETVLEKAGLVKGRHFHTQVSATSEDGRRRQPDVVIDLPGERQLVIDAKVSLVAYERQVSAEMPEERERAAKEHADAVRRHIDQLSAKDYATLPGTNAPDFVFLFVPIEPALHAALETDPSLIEHALERNIVLVTAPNVVATARLVAQLWRQENQNRHAQQIAEQGGKLYDKFYAFCKDLENVGLRIRQTQESYDAAMNKLREGRGNLIGQTSKLRELGAKVSAPPLLTAGEPEGDDPEGA